MNKFAKPDSPQYRAYYFRQRMKRRRLAGEGVLTPEFLYKYNGEATTNATTGVRELVNTGTNGTNSTLYGGHGLDTGVENIHLKTGVFARTDQPVSFIFTYVMGDYTSSNRLLGLTDSNSKRLYHGVFSNDQTAFAVACGNPYKAVVLDNNYNVGDVVHIGFTFDGLGNLSVYDLVHGITASGSGFDRFIGSTEFPLLSYLSSSGAYHQADHDDIMIDNYYIPCKLTQEEFQSHYTNPERTLYWEGNTLKSDLPSITPAVIADMQSGNGFWYPLSQNVNAVDGGVY